MKALHKGNERTTRLITTTILGKAGLNLFEIFSFENFYNQNITHYFKAVGLQGDYYELRDSIDFTYWPEYFTDGILDEFRRIHKTLPGTIQVPRRLEPRHKQILDYNNKHGSITLREYGGISFGVEVLSEASCLAHDLCRLGRLRRW